MKRMLALGLVLAGCSPDNPICLRVTPESAWAKVAAALGQTSAAAVVCPADPLAVQSVGDTAATDAGAATCEIVAGDDACILCLKQRCCAEGEACTGGAEPCAPLMTCGADNCVTACNSGDAGAGGEGS